MKIITKGVTVRSGGVNYPPGSAIEIDDDAATRLIARGCAVEAPTEQVPESTMLSAISGTGAEDPQPEAPTEQVPEPIAPTAPNKPKRGKA